MEYMVYDINENENDRVVLKKTNGSSKSLMGGGENETYEEPSEMNQAQPSKNSGVLLEKDIDAGGCASNRSASEQGR